MAVAIAVDMDAGAMAAEKMAARKPNPATNAPRRGKKNKRKAFEYMSCSGPSKDCTAHVIVLRGLSAPLSRRRGEREEIS